MAFQGGSPQCVRLLRVASILGREFCVAMVGSVSDTPESDCLGPLDEAVAAGLVQSSSAPGEYRFSHAIVRDAIEAAASGAHTGMVERSWGSVLGSTPGLICAWRRCPPEPCARPNDHDARSPA